MSACLLDYAVAGSESQAGSFALSFGREEGLKDL
jgi:hypothetical protein